MLEIEGNVVLAELRSADCPDVGMQFWLIGKIEKSVGGEEEKSVGGEEEKLVGGEEEKSVGGEEEKSVGGEEEKSVGGEVEIERELLRFFEFNGVGDSGWSGEGRGDTGKFLILWRFWGQCDAIWRSKNITA